MVTTELVNGYNVTGNHATQGREYRVCDASGRALQIADGKPAALTIANGMRPGDVVQIKPEPVAEIPPEVVAVAAPVEKPEPEKTPAVRRTTKPRGGK